MRDSQLSLAPTRREILIDAVRLPEERAAFDDWAATRIVTEPEPKQ
jgi:hypothetical protein